MAIFPSEFFNDSHRLKRALILARILVSLFDSDSEKPKRINGLI